MSVRTWDGGARTALLLHCSLARASAWTPVAERLAEAGITAIAPNLPGHGQAPMPDPDRDFLDQAVEGAIAALPGPVHVVGHSYGGVVALRLAVERPDLVTGLTLYEPVFFAAARGTPAHEAHAVEFAAFPDAIAAGDADRAARVFLGFWGEGPDFDAMPPAQQIYIRDRIHLIPMASPGMNEDASGVLPRLSDLTMPVTLLLGERCLPITRATAIGLSARIRQMQIEEMPGAGHMGPLTAPAAFADRVTRDMAQAPGSSIT